MSDILFVIGAIALVGGAYYSYQRKKSWKTVSKEGLINGLVSNLNAEIVERLSLSDVVNYFKSLNLKKSIDVPFIATATKNGVKSYLLATYNEKTQEVLNGKLIQPKSLDEELEKMIGNETFVVLN